MENIKNEEILFDWDISTNKYNNKIKLTKEDEEAGLKVLCKEPYAQSLYDEMVAWEKSSGVDISGGKDLVEGDVYEVKASKISFDDKMIYAEEVNSGVEITIPFKEFSQSVEDLVKGEGLYFSVMITTEGRSGEFIGSERKCLSINYKKEIMNHLDKNTWFEVKIKKLIKGGYIASYKDGVDCFIPGSHAGANVIRDFSKLLGTSMNVMVDNYDKANDLFILSYKKYIDRSMQYMVSDLHFGFQYTGTLTQKPYDFGVFVEFEGYYTGLIHSSEFENYDEIKKTLKAGDDIQFYIKNVTKKNNKYRIVLTLHEDTIDPMKKRWDALRTRTENQTFNYDVNENSNSIKIHIDDESYDVTLRRKDLERNLNHYPRVRVSKVDPINRRLKFEFVEQEEVV